MRRPERNDAEQAGRGPRKQCPTKLPHKGNPLLYTAGFTAAALRGLGPRAKPTLPVLPADLLDNDRQFCSEGRDRTECRPHG